MVSCFQHTEDIAETLNFTRVNLFGKSGDPLGVKLDTVQDLLLLLQSDAQEDIVCPMLILLGSKTLSMHGRSL